MHIAQGDVQAQSPKGDSPIHGAAIYIHETQFIGDTLGQSALASAGRTINRYDDSFLGHSIELTRLACDLSDMRYCGLRTLPHLMVDLTEPVGPL